MALTGTYSNGKLTVKSTNSAATDISSIHIGTAAETGDAIINVVNTAYTEGNAPEKSSITQLDASGVAAKSALNFTAIQSQLEELQTLSGTKGADTIDASTGLTVKGNAGADVIIADGGTISDYDGTSDIIKFSNFGTDDSFSMSNISAEYKGKNLTLTYGDGDGDDAKSITITNGRDKKILIADAAGTVKATQYFPTDEDYYEITNANTGAEVTTKANIIDGSARKAAVAIHATKTIDTEDEETDKTPQSIVGGTGADTIYAEGTNQIITTGKGADYVVINKDSGNVTIEDFSLGDSVKSGDAIALDSVVITGETYEDGNVVFTFATSAGADKAGTITVQNAEWDQKTSANKSMIRFATYQNGTMAPDTANTKTYSDPQKVIVTGKVSQTTIDLTDSATISAIGTGGLIVGTGSQMTTATTQLDFSNVSNNLNITAGVGTAATSAITNITGGKGKDTITANGSASSEEAEELTITTVNASATASYNVSYTSSEEEATTVSYTIVTVNNVIEKITDSNNATQEKVTFTLSGGTSKEWSVGSGFSSKDAQEAGLIVGDATTGTSSKYYNISFSNGTIINYVEDSTNFSTLSSKISGYTLSGTFNYSDSTSNYGLTATANSTSSDGLIVDGGAGNDYLTGSKAQIYGGAGNDTFRAAAGGGATFIDEAGNDVFVLTGEDEDADEVTANAIVGYSGDTNTTVKKTYGTDKIIVQYDKYNPKNTSANGRFEIVGGNVSDGLVIAGSKWATYTGNENNDYGLGTAATVGSFNYSNGLTSKFTISFAEGVSQLVDLTEQGITYKQTVDASNANEGAVTVSANFLGYLDPNATKVYSAAGKANRIDARGLSTSAESVELVGNNKVDTLMGNADIAVNMTGGAGNDIFYVTDGDTIEDYSASGSNGKDKVALDRFGSFGELTNVTKDDNGKLTIKADTTVMSTSAFTYTVSDADTTTAPGYNIYTITLTQTANGSSGTITVKTATETNIVETINTTNISMAEGASYTLSLSTGDSFIKGTTSLTINEIAVDTDASTSYSFTMTSAAGSAITFTYSDTNVTAKAKNNTVSGYTEKTTTNTMVRTFGTDATITLGAKDGNYFKVFAGETNAQIINASKAAASTIVNEASNVASIVGGGKNDIIYVGTLGTGNSFKLGTDADAETANAITVQSGKGNDIIVWNGESNVVLTDYTGITYNNKGLMTAGDIIVFGDGVATEQSFAGSNVVYTNGENTLTIVGAKDAKSYVTNSIDEAEALIGKTLAFTTASGELDATLRAIESFANPAEYLLNSKGDDAHKKYTATQVTEGIKIVNASAVGKQNIDLTADGVESEAVTEVYAGTGNDTIIAMASVTDIDAGKGADYVDVVSVLGTANVTLGAGNDIIRVGHDDTEESTAQTINITDYNNGTNKLYFATDDIPITAAMSTSELTVQQYTSGTGNKAKTINWYKGLTINAGENNTIQFGSLNADNLKINVIDVADDEITPDKLAKANSFSLDYFSNDVTVGASDGSTINFTGANASNITIDKTRKKAVTIKEVAASTTVMGTGAGAGITVIGVNGNSESSEATYDYTTSNANGVTANYDASTKKVTIIDGSLYAVLNEAGTEITSIVDNNGDAVSSYTIDNTDKLTFYTSEEATSTDDRKYTISYTAGANAEDAPTVKLITYTGSLQDEGGTTSTPGARYALSAKADVYEGNGASDHVTLGAGNDTVKRGGAARIVSGTGNNVFQVQKGDAYKIEGFSANDKLVTMGTDGVSLQKSEWSNSNLILSFGTSADDASMATVQLSSMSQTQSVSINTFTFTTKGSKVTSKVSNELTMSFGTGTRSVAAADSATIDAVTNEALFDGVSAITVNESVSGGKYIIGNSDITAITGAKGKDTLSATAEDADENAVVNLTGNKGADTFIANFSNTYGTSTVVIKDFTTKDKDVLYFGNTKFTYADLGTNYEFDSDAKTLTLTDDIGNKVELDTVELSKTGGSASVLIWNTETKKAVATTFSDNVNIVMTASQTANTFGSSVKTLDASKAKATNVSAITVDAGEEFSSFIGGAATAAITFTTVASVKSTIKAGAGKVTAILGTAASDITSGAGGVVIDASETTGKVTVAGKAGDDSIKAGAELEFTYDGGGKDVIEGANAKTSLALASGWSITGAESVTKSTAKFAVKKGNATGSIEYKAASTETDDSPFTFTWKVTKDNETTTGEGDDATTTYDWTKTYYIKAKGMSSEVVYATEVDKAKSENPYSTESGTGIKESSYEERGFEELVNDNNFAAASDLDNITSVAADDAAIAVDYSATTNLFNAADFTQVTAAANKKAQA